MPEIQISVFRPADRKYYYVQWRDPITGKLKTRSSGKTVKSQAERFGGALQKEIIEGKHLGTMRTTWEDFRVRYEDEYVSGLKDTTAGKICATFNAIEEIVNPRLLASLNGQISRFTSELRKGRGKKTIIDKDGNSKTVVKYRGISETTIKGHLAHLSAALNWAVREGLLHYAPEIEKPHRAKKSRSKMKGRPITLEEFERMLRATRDVVGKKAAKSWRHYLRGLWLSGLRLEESMNLYWDRLDRLCIDTTGRFPMLIIPAEYQKSHEDQHLPIVPEFANYILRTRPEKRTGPVFDPLPRRKKGPRLKPHRVGELVSAIGKKANVVVFSDSKTGKVKFASAHDLRRSFGDRWKTRVTPHVLKELMRHKNIETTNRYYLSENAAGTAKLLWEMAATNTLTNTRLEEAP